MTTAWQRQDLAGGRLRSEQHLVWHGAVASPTVLREAPRLLERAHCQSIERYSLGCIRCQRERGGIVCRLLGGPVVLGFADAATDAGADAAADADDTTERRPGRVVRRWTILSGWFARRLEEGISPTDGYGTLTITLDMVTTAPAAQAYGGGTCRFEAAIAVEGFPSRFLGVSFPRVRGLRWVWRLVGGCYAAYHAQAGFSCLRRVRAALTIEVAGASKRSSTSGSARNDSDGGAHGGR